MREGQVQHKGRYDAGMMMWRGGKHADGNAVDEWNVGIVF